MSFAGLTVLNREGRRERNENKTMNGNLHVAMAAFGAAIAVGMIGMKAADVVGRNPGSSTKVLVQSILAIAFAEAIVFYTLFLVR
jgi:F-type H+-transporting ATPase subunit c